MSQRSQLKRPSLLVPVILVFLLISCSGSGGVGGVDQEDGIAPSAVTDLAAANVTVSSVTLRWTAPGDDDSTGTAAAYDLRYSTVNNLWTDWDSATVVTGAPSPLPAGSVQTMTVSGLDEDSTYYFGLMTGDEAGNWSFVSNIVHVTCFDDYVVIFPDASLEAVIRAAINKPAGDIHKLDLVQIVDLWAEQEGITDLTGLEHCTNLAYLTLIDNTISGIGVLASMTGLKSLNLMLNHVSDVSSLAGLTGLEHLSLSNNALTNIDPLAGLINLEELSIRYNDVSDIGAITGLSALDWLDMRYNQIGDIAALVDNPGLASGDEIWLEGNPLSYQAVNEHIPALQTRGVTVHWDVDAIAPAAVTDLAIAALSDSSVTLTWTAPGDDGIVGTANLYEIRYSTDSLTVVGWTGADVASMPASPQTPGATEEAEVAGLTADMKYYFALRTRDESDNWAFLSNIVCATPFEDAVVVFPDANLEAAVRLAIAKPASDIFKSDLFALQELLAVGQSIVDLTGIEYCVTMETLNLRDNAITDVAPLAGLTRMRNLNLNNNQITDIAALSGMTQLQQLYFDENQVSDISPLAGAVAVQYLSFSGNSVTDIGTVANMPDLVWLSLMGNGVSDLTPLTGKTFLFYLFLSNNQIADISVLGGITSIMMLYLDNNQITDIGALEYLLNLSNVYVRFNQVADISPLVDNAGIGGGDEVGLTGNPLSQTSLDVYIPALETRGVTVLK